jgi:hypothetical protein
MKRPLIFKNYDQAVNFKILNDLSKDVQPLAMSFKKTVLLYKGKIIKMNIEDKEGKEWIITQ